MPARRRRLHRQQTASRNESRHQIGAFLANATPDQAQAFEQHKTLPAGVADAVLAHGISTAFLVGVVFAAIALVVSMLAIRAKASEVDISAVPGLAG